MRDVLSRVSLMALLALMTTGCVNKAVGGEPPTLGPTTAEYAYTIAVTKSELNTEEVDAPLPTNVGSMKEIMAASAIRYESVRKGDQEVLTSLDGILVTASKTWYLYIEGKKTMFISLSDVAVTPEQKIEWKYEAMDN